MIKGQTSLEYVLILSGAITLAAIIVYYALSLVPSDQTNTQLNEQAIFRECANACTQCVPLQSQTQANLDDCTSKCKKSALDNTVDASVCYWVCTPWSEDPDVQDDWDWMGLDESGGEVSCT